MILNTIGFEANELETVQLICACQVLMNVTFDLGSQAAENAKLIRDIKLKNEMESLANIACRVRFDADFLQKKLSKDENVQDYLYEIMPYISEINKKMIMMDIAKLDKISKFIDELE